MTDLIKRRADGSIDTALYVRRGRMARGQAAHDMVRKVIYKRATRMGTVRPWILRLAIVSIAALTLPYIV